MQASFNEEDTAQFDNTLIGSNVVVALQKFLSDKGIYNGKNDGLFGAETIRMLQAYLGTTADGIYQSGFGLC